MVIAMKPRKFTKQRAWFTEKRHIWARYDAMNIADTELYRPIVVVSRLQPSNNAWSCRISECFSMDLTWRGSSVGGHFPTGLKPNETARVMGKF